MKTGEPIVRSPGAPYLPGHAEPTPCEATPCHAVTCLPGPMKCITGVSILNLF